jgi:hypothetical protein
MKKLLLASVAIIALGASPAFAQIIKSDANASANTDAGAAVGGTTGGVAGAIAGGLVFGPIGAVIGGFTGATIGATAGVQATSVDYVRLHPTDPVVVEGNIDAGFVVPTTVVVHPIEGDAKYGYFYTQDRVYFVDLSNNTVVYSPGTVVAAK